MDLNKEKDKLNLFLNTKKYKFSIVGSNPSHDWIVMVNIALILIIISSVIYIQDHREINSSVSKEVTIDSKKELFDVEPVKDLLSQFDERKANFDYLNKPAEAIDQAQ